MHSFPARILQVLSGPVAPLGTTGATSAIDKRPVAQPVAIGPQGLSGDAQADLRVHGGPDKAVHLYAWAHYAQWQRELGGEAALPPGLLQAPGAFCENLAVADVDEGGVCIGDHWRAGTAVLQVTQGRQPCWKLNLRFGVPDMAARVQQTLRAGWYCRTLQPGIVQAGDALELLERPHPGWTVERLLALIRDRECQPYLMGQVLELPLPPSWRKLFARRMEQGLAEDWQARLQG
ncbi:MOSC domain-containing protein [Paracidovorax sp. MALMAid1276]|uniref:MOSC domain-containing protein n=1 Tax=Paracidovorax sp. MALMAid1276 TaxID=3411631 RepID=UPI003B9C4552